MLISSGYAMANEVDIAEKLQQQINEKYRHFFGPDSQSLLPLNKMEISDWKALRANQTLKRLYTESDKFYNSKVYTFTLYQSTENGSFYLDATGGFWGMDELVYGPFSATDLQ